MAKKNRKIIQYDTLGNIVEIYPNAKVAAMETGIGTSAISRCCNGLRKKSGGYVFAFEGEEPSFEGVDPPIIQYDLFGNKIEEFYNIQEVGEKYPKYTLQAIRSCLAGEKNYYANSFWGYVGEEGKIPEKVEEYGRQVVAKSLDCDTSKDIYFGNIQIAQEETGINRTLINRALNLHGLCNGYAWFRFNDKKNLKKFENFELEYFEFSKRTSVRVTYPTGMEKEFNSIKSAAIHIDMPIHLVYCLAHGTHLDESQGYKIEILNEK